MKSIFKYIVIASAVAAVSAACDKWTDTEPVNVVYETLESKNPELWAKYLKSLRDYHNTEHQVLIAKFDNKPTEPEGRGDHISCLPDSVDYVILNNPLSLSEETMAEMKEIRDQKGIRTLLPISLDEIESGFDRMIQDEIDAYWQQEDADYDGQPQATPERFSAYVSEYLQPLLDAVSSYGYDGIDVIYNGANPASYTQSKLEAVTVRQGAMFGLIDSWIGSHDKAVVFFEGTPGYVVCENSVIASAKYIIVPAVSESNEHSLSYVVSKLLVNGAPTDRTIIGVTAVDITDPTNVNGTFGDISAIVGAAQWAVHAEGGFAKKGVCVDHAQFDYYDITNVYSQINKAISIMNPSPVK